MKQNLFNKLWLRVGMIVAIMTTALAGTAWAQQTSTIFLETFGSTSSNTAFASYNGYAATTAMFNDGQAVNTHYSGSGSVGKNNLSGVNLSSGYTGASGLSGCYHGGTANTTATIIQISNINISGFENLSLSFGALGGSTSHKVDVSYKIDGGTETSLISNGSITNANWTLLSANISGTGESLTLYFKHTPTKAWTIRMDDIKVTGTSSSGSSAVATTTTIDATGITNTDIYAGTAAGTLTASVTAGGSAVSGATVTWSSSNTNIATVAADGAVTLVAAGTTTITANYAGVVGQYEPSSATYDLTVTDSTPFTGGDVTFVCGTDVSETTSITKDGVTMTMTSGVWNRTDNYRLYANQSLTISTESGTITSIVFTISQNNFTGDGYNAETKTWTGNASSVTLAADGGQVRFTPVVVTVDLGATPDPVISADNVNIAYGATSGSFDFSVNNPVTGGAITVSEDVDWISNATVSGNSVTFTTTANGETTPRTGVITLTYTYNTNETVTKDVTITQAAAPAPAVVYTTIPALFDAATTTEAPVYVTFNNWVVTGVNGGQVFVTDGTNGFVMYQKDHGFVVGNTLSGTVSCNLVLYNGYAEITGLTATTEGLTVGTNGSVTPVATTIDALGAVNTGSVVTLSNLTCSVSTSGNYTNYDLSDGTNTIRAFSSIYDFTANPDLEDGNTYSVTGIFCYNTSAVRIYPRSAADIEEVEAPVQTTVTAGTLSHVAISGLYDGDMEDITLGENVAAGTLVYFTLNVEAGYTLESVSVLDASNDEVTLTETQGAWSFYMPNSSVKINATAVLSDGESYALFTGALVEGDYIIYYNGKAMNTTVSSNRLQYEEVTPASNDVITISATDNAIVWHIAPSGDYWTIYNAAANAYAAGTGAANKAQMLADGTDDKALWTVTGTETYEFVNKQNTANNVNANLRNNGTYGFACYGTGTGGALSLYKKVEATPADDVEVNIAIGYSTLYYGDRNLVVPADVEAYTYKVTNKLEVSKTYEAGDVIPAGTAVVLKAANGSYTFEATTETGEGDEDNALKGSDEAATTTGGTYYYALSLNANSEASSVGFYWMAAEGGAFTCGAHKAYLALSKTFAQLASGEIKGFVALPDDDDATAISTVESFTEEGAIFNLAGQRLQKMQKGINIVNGKKILK